MVDELNIYESIYKNALTGSVVMTDAQNSYQNYKYKVLKDYHLRLRHLVTRSRDYVDGTEKTGHIFIFTNHK